VISREPVIFENSFRIEGGTFKIAGHVSTEVKVLLKRLKLPKEIVMRAAVVTYEVEMNIGS
jgi:hypothetical protein